MITITSYCVLVYTCVSKIWFLETNLSGNMSGFKSQNSGWWPVPKRVDDDDDEPQQSMESCFHFACSKQGERYVFLGLKTMHVVRVCSDCHDDVYDLSNLLYDLCMEITTFGIPNPLSTWRIGDSYQITNLSTLKLLMRYLRDTLLILEVKISTRWPAYTKIVKVVENLTLNIANIGEQEEIENS